MTEPPHPPGGYQPPDPYYRGEPSFPPPADPAGGYPYGYLQPDPAPRAGLGERLGARVLRRPEPRFTVGLAGAGAALVLLGAVVWAAGYYADGQHFVALDESLSSSGNDSRRFLGVVLFLGVTVAGYAVAITRRHGAAASAGAVGAALGVPFTLGFLTLDAGNFFRGQLPISIDAVFLVSIAAWMIDYFALPGLRGRSFLLAAAAIATYSYLGFKVAGNNPLSAGSSPFGFGSGADTGSLAAVGLLFGLGYYGIAAFLDSRGRAGAAVALVVAGFDATVGGIAAGASDIGAAGTGTLLVFVGLGLAWYGARSGRRFTTWVWSLGVALGLVLIVGKIFDNSYTGGGITLAGLGVLVIVGARLVATESREPADIEEASGQAVPAAW
jgi:hypothetical protein